VLTAQREALARWLASPETEALIVKILTLGFVGVPAIALIAAFGWFGLAVFLVGALTLGLSLTLFRPEPSSASDQPRYQRPLGQMVIATIVNELIAVGLGIATLLGGAFAIAGVPGIPRAALPVPSDLAVMITAVVLVCIQGVILPLYAWWRWSADRDQERLANEIVKAMQDSTVSENAEQLRQEHVEIERLTDLRRALENEVENLEEERTRRADNAE
jgi:hypothetical protein